LTQVVGFGHERKEIKEEEKKKEKKIKETATWQHPL